MGILKRAFLGRREWWLLEPDQGVFAAGGITDGEVLHLGARHAKGRWVMMYLAEECSFSVNMGKVAGGNARACWINPETGEAEDIGTFAASGEKGFTTPEGWEDALLVLEAGE